MHDAELVNHEKGILGLATWQARVLLANRRKYGWRIKMRRRVQAHPSRDGAPITRYLVEEWMAFWITLTGGCASTVTTGEV